MTMSKVTPEIKESIAKKLPQVMEIIEDSGYKVVEHEPLGTEDKFPRWYASHVFLVKRQSKDEDVYISILMSSTSSGKPIFALSGIIGDITKSRIMFVRGRAMTMSGEEQEGISILPFLSFMDHDNGLSFLRGHLDDFSKFVFDGVRQS